MQTFFQNFGTVGSLQNRTTNIQTQNDPEVISGPTIFLVYTLPYTPWKTYTFLTNETPYDLKICRLRSGNVSGNTTHRFRLGTMDDTGWSSNGGDESKTSVSKWKLLEKSIEIKMESNDTHYLQRPAPGNLSVGISKMSCIYLQAQWQRTFASFFMLFCLGLRWKHHGDKKQNLRDECMEYIVCSSARNPL